MADAAAVGFDPLFSLQRASRTLSASERLGTTKSLAELAAVARQRLNAEGSGRKLASERHGASGSQEFARGSEFQRFHARLRNLSLGKSDYLLAAGQGPVAALTPGTLDSGSSAASVWAFLQSKYENIFLQMIDDGVDDGFRRAAVEAYQRLFLSWSEDVASFEDSIRSANLSGEAGCRDISDSGAHGNRTNIRGSSGREQDDGLSPEERLLLVCLCRKADDVRALSRFRSAQLLHGTGGTANLHSGFAPPSAAHRLGTPSSAARAGLNMSEWGTTPATATVGGPYPTDGQGRDDSSGGNLDSSELVVKVSVGPREGKPVYQLLEEITRWSLSCLGDQRYSSECVNLWEIMGCLCGVRDKHGGSVAEMQLLLLNSLQRLEHLCIEQISKFREIQSREEASAPLSSVGRLSRRSAAAGLSGIRRQLLDFCDFDRDPHFPSSMTHLWQLAYWAFRSGFPRDLDILADTDASAVRFPVSPEFSCVCLLLANRLQETSSSLLARNDNAKLHASVNLRGEGHASRIALSEEDMQEKLKELRVAFPNLDGLNSTAALLVSLVDPKREPVALKRCMPNATAEDFIWYNVHWILLHAQIDPGCLVPELLRLQNKILVAGPSHFSSRPSDAEAAKRGDGGYAPVQDLNFAKVLLYTLRISDALAWIMDTVPALKTICLHWTFYLAKMGLIGGPYIPDDSHPQDIGELGQFGILPLVVERPNGLDSLCLSVVCSAMLSDASLKRKIPFLQLLPLHDKLNFLDDCLDQHLDELATGDALGSVDLSDGQVTKGPVFYALLPIGGTAQGDEDRREIFEGAVINVTEKLEQLYRNVDVKWYHNVIKLYYIADLHVEAIGTLVKAFNSPALFPSFGSISEEVAAQQAWLLRFFQLYERNVEALGLNGEVWDSCCLARKLVEAYILTRENKIQEAIEYVDSEDLIPSRQTLAVWCRSQFADHLPRIIDAYVFCLYDLSRRGLQPPRDAVHFRDRIHNLLSLTNELTEAAAADPDRREHSAWSAGSRRLDSAPASGALQRLRVLVKQFEPHGRAEDTHLAR